MKKRIKIQGSLIFLGIVIVILFSKFLFPQWKKEALDEFLDAVGIGLILFGFLFRMAARGHKAEMSSEGKKLVTSGIYALIRNPMYFGTFLIGTGVVLVLFKWWVFILFLAIFLGIYTPQINKEEKILSEYFGQEYHNYRKNVPMYFPSILNLFKIDLRDYIFFKWPGIKKELPSLMAVVGAIIAAEAWEDVRLFGHKEYGKELLELLLIISCLLVVIFLFYKKDDVSGKD